MGGRGYKNNVNFYLSDANKSAEFENLFMLDNDKIDIIKDKKSSKAPTMPIFSNTAN